MVDKQHCNPKEECTTKYEMKCEALPESGTFVISSLENQKKIYFSSDRDPLHYGYIQEHCDYKPVAECKMQSRCENIPEEICRPVQREVCDETPVQQCQVIYERKCKNEPIHDCKTTYAKDCKSVYKGDQCHYAKPKKKCHTVYKEKTKYLSPKSACIWPDPPKSSKC